MTGINPLREEIREVYIDAVIADKKARQVRRFVRQDGSKTAILRGWSGGGILTILGHCPGKGNLSLDKPLDLPWRDN